MKEQDEEEGGATMLQKFEAERKHKEEALNASIKARNSERKRMVPSLYASSHLYVMSPVSW